MKEEKRECEEKIAAILNDFVEKWRPNDIDLSVIRLSEAGGVYSVGVKVELKF